MSASNATGRIAANTAEEERIGRLLNEYLDRRQRGERISRELLQTEHPDLASALAEHLSLLQALTDGADPIQELLSKRVLSPPGSAEALAELGSYQITGVIGRGGMGIVLRAIERPLGRPVALKILRPELAVDHRALIRFEHEARAAAALRHPNIVTVHACGALDGTHYLAMEAIDGPSLAERLVHEPPLTTDEIRRIFRELLTGLGAAHDAGLVHRDIKSSNILLDGPDQRVKIADFGLARITASHTRITMPQSAIGTPEYMSPEQARGDENVDHRTDLYSAGVVLYEMLTGRVPFRGESPSALIHSILNKEPLEPRRLRRCADRRLSHLALRLMAKHAEERFNTASTALEAQDAGRRIRLPRSARSSDPARRMRRVMAAFVIILLAVVSSAMLAWPSGQLVAVRVARDGDVFLPTVEAWRERGLRWSTLYAFTHEGAGVVDAAVVRPPDEGEPFALVGIDPPYESDTLFAIDRRGDLMWGANLTDTRRWPDCGLPNAFRTVVVEPTDFDGVPGDEVILVASNRYEYPTYVALFDPVARTMKAKYWHFGYLHDVTIVPELFGEGKPGLVLTGMNNKLDGFNERRAGDAQPAAHYDYVPIIMTLDVSTMGGEKLINVPDSNGRVVDMETVLPSGYAALDVSDGKVVAVDPITRETRQPGSADPVMVFDKPEVVRCSAGAPAQCVHLKIARVPQELGGAYFRLTPGFECLYFMPSSTESSDRTVQSWSRYFKPYVRNGALAPATERHWTCDGVAPASH